MTQTKKLENLNGWLGMVTKNKDIIIVFFLYKYKQRNYGI